MKKKFSLSITEFALPSPLAGSIDAYSGFALGQELGNELHQEIQYQRSKENASYETEVWIAHDFKFGKYVFEVSGKIDGLCRGKKTIIEEIKTAFDLKKLLKFIKTNCDHPYLLQLKTYGYIYWLKTKKIPLLNLYAVSSRNRKSTEVSVEFDLEEYELWLKNRLKELAAEVKNTEKLIKKRKKIASSLTFPFSDTRVGQKELIETVRKGISEKVPMLLQAPTGLGKTMGILFPILEDSLNRGQKAIYLTPKNSQHMVAADAAKQIRKSGSKIKSLILTAKKKICMKQEPLCNAEYCEFAENHYSKVSENRLIEKLQKEKHLSIFTFKKMAEAYQVCPYELQMNLINQAEVVICDYNYVFSPHSQGTRVAKLKLAEVEKPNLIIDEVHNLPSRAMDYYSPALVVSFFEKAHRIIEKIPKDLQKSFDSLLEQCIKIIFSYASNNHRPHLIIPKIQQFKDQEQLLRDFLMSYLESDVVIGPNDIVLSVFNYWHDFTAALDWISTEQKEFFIAYYPKTPCIKITCCDASEMIKESYPLFNQVIGFSATLKPFDYYSQLIGLHSKKLKKEEFSSPFPKGNRKLIIIPQVSSKYVDRIRNYPRIADAIRRIIELKSGNYFAFFPSFEFMENVLSFFKPPTFFNIFSQYSGMTAYNVKMVLKQLMNEKANIIFAVQGGVFSEGIDYPGKMSIGVFVVGTPLPNFNWERERLKEFYETEYNKGEEYAYIYPAMTKAIQAAGRVIRSETDKGIIVLMDDRFLQQNYAQCMPTDWYEKDPTEIAPKGILDKIKAFWDNE